MEKMLPKILILLGWIVIVIGIINNLDMTIHYNATQYVAEGEKPDPIRIATIISDVVSPFFQGFILIGMAYVIKYLRGDKPAN